jgi:hypothetical protein
MTTSSAYVQSNFPGLFCISCRSYYGYDQIPQKRDGDENVGMLGATEAATDMAGAYLG